MNVTYDSLELNASPYFVDDLVYEEAPPRDVHAYQLSRERGSVIVNTEYRAKVITIKGRITGTSKNDLDENIDDLMIVLTRENKNLDIDHQGSTRRYEATKLSCTPARRYYNLNYATYVLKFLIPKGVGRNTSLTEISENNITVASKSGSWSVTGSAYPNPTIQMTFDSASSVTKIEITVNGDKITLTETISAADVVLFDIENKKVTINGTEKDYAGVFPRFSIGANSYQVDVTSTSHQYDSLVKYYKKWL